MPYQYVREPLTAEESDRVSIACKTPTERLLVWTLLDTGLRVGELCDSRVGNLAPRSRSVTNLRIALVVAGPKAVS